MILFFFQLNGVQNYPQLPQDASKPINIYVKVKRVMRKHVVLSFYLIKPLDFLFQYDLQPEEQFDDNRRTYVELLVSARNSAGVKVYDGYLKMRLIKVSGYLHVQTDRPIYRYYNCTIVPHQPLAGMWVLLDRQWRRWEH